MSWGLPSWKRQSDAFHVLLGYGDREQEEQQQQLPTLFRNGQPLNPGDPGFPVSSSGPDPTSQCKFRIQLDWSAGDDEEQVALKLQSQLMITLPAPHDHVQVELRIISDHQPHVRVNFTVRKKREMLKAISVTRTSGSSPQGDGWGVLTRLMGSASSDRSSSISVTEELLGYTQHWRSLAVLNLSGCSLTTLPIDVSRVPMLEKIFLDNNKLSVLPPEIGQLERLQVLRLDHNMLLSVPAELKQCAALVELSLEHNKLVRPLLDFRAMTELCTLRLFGNPLEFLPEILPCTKLRYLSLANVHIDGNEELSTVNVHIETENVSYFVAAKHKLSAFFALIFRFSSCQHPLLASALAKIAQDDGNRSAIGKDESAVRQLLSMMLSDNRHVVEQACLALSSLASDALLALRLMKADIMQPIGALLKASEPLLSMLQVVVNLAFSSDAVAARMLTKELLKWLKMLCAHNKPEVQRLALLAIGNLAFCRENRTTLAASESLRELLLRLSAASNLSVSKAAMRALAILGENEYLRRAVRGRPVGKQGLCILSMDGGGMRGLATVQMLRRLEEGTGKHIYEMFDLICGTSTGGMLAVALGIKGISLDECEEVYKNLGKLVFAEPIPKDNEAATWREKLDQLYKSSSQSFRVVVHGSKHNADEFERLLKEMCAHEDGDLLIESAVKGIPKVFVVASLVSVTPAQPFVFRNYQYPVGTPEKSACTTEGPAASVFGTSATASPLSTQIGPNQRSAFIGSCKHCIWEAIRASSAAPYYLDDFFSDANRWQDGAIVANNPTIIAIREAQLLWPDTKIGCLVSIGCGNVPTKPRGKGGWRYLDTGQVLIESACSVERVEEALDTLLPILPDMHYFRFNPVDDRCGMELDETDPSVWVKLEAATQEYIDANAVAFQSACDCLVPPLPEEDQWAERLRNSHLPGNIKAPGKAVSMGDGAGPFLGWRRRVFLAEAWGSSEFLKLSGHIRSLESFCARHIIKLENFSSSFGASNAAASSSTPFASPLFSGSFPGSPLLHSPELGLHQWGHPEFVPPLSLDGGQSHLLSGKMPHSPQKSPSLGPPQLPGPTSLLNERLQSSPQVGIVHLALQSDLAGLILSWQSDIFAVAEPGESAEAFLQNVITSMCLSSGDKIKKQHSVLRRMSTIATLVSKFPKFYIGRALYRFIGRQTQVLADEREVGAYLFQRTLPSTHLTSEDVRWMVGAWRDRIVICTGKFAPPAHLLKAFLDAGAKAVIASALKLPAAEQTAVSDSVVASNSSTEEMVTGNFVIGDEDDEEESESNTPDSDWEDGDLERTEQRIKRQEREEMELGSFTCTLYSALFKDGLSANLALQHAMEAHPKMIYACHLPSI